MNLRIQFEKTDTAKYISHLDLTTVFSRIFARSSFPVWFTQGFNPHPYMVFSPPLQVCTESVCEMLDIKTDKVDLDLSSIPGQLTSVSPNGIRITDAYVPEMPFKQISRAVYEYTVNDQYKEAFRDFLNRESIVIEKRTKRGTTEIDLAKELAIIPDTDRFIVSLPSSPENTIGANYLSNAFGESFIKIRRLYFLDQTGERFR